MNCTLAGYSWPDISITDEGHTIYGHEQQLLRLHNLEELLQIPEDLYDHLLFCYLPSWVIPMRAVVDDTVHVQVQVVDHWHVCFCYRLIYKRVPLAQPPIKFRNTCNSTD